MDKNESLVKKTLIYLAGNFSSKIFGFIIIPVYATFLSAVQLGQYDFQQTIANFLQPIIALAIWESILRFGLKSKGKELKTIFSTAVVIFSVTLSIAFVILLLTYINFYGLNLTSILYVLMIIFLPVVTILGYMSRATKNTAVFAFSGVLSSFINLVGISIFVIWKKMGLEGLLISTILANIFNSCSLFFGSHLYKYISYKYFSLEQAKILLSFSMPLILNLVFGWFTSSFSRFYINTTIGTTENGIYAFAMKFSTIILQISAIINMTMIEDAVQTIGMQKWTERFETNISNVGNIFFRSAFLMLPLIGIYYHTISNDDFSSSLSLVPLLIYCTIMNNTSTMLGNVFTVFNKTTRIFLTTMISGLTNIFGAVIFGRFFGLWGILISQLLGSIILLTTRYFYGRKIRYYRLNWFQIFFNTLIFIIISCGVLSRNIIIQIFLLVIMSIYSYHSYKEWIKTQLRAISNKFFSRN